MKKNKKSYSVGSSVILAILLVFLGIGAFVYFFVIRPSRDGLAPRASLPSVPETGEGAVLDGGVFSYPRKEGVFNVLVVGRDAAGANTDVVMLLSLDSPAGTLSVLQIPRDSYIDDPVNADKNKKLNAIYAHAYNSAGSSGDMSRPERQRYALSYLCRTVSSLFGVDVDRYVYVDLAAFRSIVDTVGGVEISVPRDLDYDDPEQDLHIHIKKGTRVLNGSDAEGFVRFRSGYTEADLARLDAQKIFLSALASKLLSSDAAARLPQLAQSFYEFFITDLSLSDLSYLASSAARLDTSKIFMVTASGGAFVSQSGAWFYGLDPDGNLELVNRFFNCRTGEVTASDMKMTSVGPGESDRDSSDVYSAADVNSKKLIPR